MIFDLPGAIPFLPGNAKEATGLTDIAAHALHMLQHAQLGLHLPGLDLIAGCVAHSRTSCGGQRGYPTGPGCLLQLHLLGFATFFTIVLSRHFLH